MTEIPENVWDLFDNDRCNLCGIKVRANHDHKDCTYGNCTDKTYQDVHFEWHKRLGK